MILNNLQNINAQLIEENLSQKERLIKLNSIARRQMEILKDNRNIKELENIEKNVNENQLLIEDGNQ